MLNTRQRSAILELHAQGIQKKQIARTLNVNINTVRTRLKRAREKMLALRKQVDYAHL